MYSSNGRSLLAADSGHVCCASDDDTWTGAAWGTAAEGERAALLSSAVYVMRMCPACPIHFWFDSTTAGFSASGRWNHNPEHRDAVLVRCVFQVLEARCRYGIHYGHVKAHQGDPYNELANSMAYDALVCQKQNTVLDFSVNDMLHGDRPLCAHWVTVLLASSGGTQYPGFDHGCIVWKRDQARPHGDTVWSDFKHSNTQRRNAEVSTLTCVSFNVRTLNAHSDEMTLHGSVGAYALLEAQLVDRCVDIAFLQETRCRTSHVLSSANYKRFAAAADNGVGGTEVWIAQRPMTSGGMQLIRGKNHVVLYQHPECLIVRVEMFGGPLFLVSAHAPHSSHSSRAVQNWWDELAARLTRFEGAGRIVAGIDANAHFAQRQGDIVGGVGLESRANYPAECFLQFLRACTCWLPATFEQHQYGVTESWRHPGRGTWHRCDYIAISRSVQHGGIQTWVDGNIDAGGSNVDHLAVAMRIFLTGEHGPSGPPHNLGARIDVKALVGANEEEVAELFRDLHPIDWQSNIHDHGAVFVRQLRQTLEQRFPKNKRGPKKSFITEETWHLRGVRRSIRRRLYHRRHLAQWSDIGAAWQAWKDDVSLQQTLAVGSTWSLLRILADLKDRMLLRRSGFQLRQCIRDDKERYCQQVASEAAQLPASLVIRKLRCLGFRSKKTPNMVRPLNEILDQDNEMYADVDTVNKVWHKFFEEMEDGEEVTHEELLRRCDCKHQTEQPPTPQLEELLTLLDLENALRKNQYSKASYFDGIPSDLGRRYPHLLARAFVHLAWKQQLLVQEPVSYKGGILIQAFKGRGSPGLCENYRALMVSSILAKSTHRTLRAGAMDSFSAYRLPLQIGGLAGRSVAQGAHCLLSYVAMCRRERKSYAVLFVDVKQAFYRLFREHIVSTTLSDEAIQRLFSTLHLPPTAFGEFARELEEISAMEAAGASPFVQAHVQEALHGTWFKLMGAERISQTRRGSRPGDNMADILFAFAFRRILQKVLDQLNDEGCPMQVESLGVAHPYPDQLGVYPLVTFDALGPVWADDLALLVAADTAQLLINKLTYVGGVLFDHLERAGMQVNFGAGKTEAVLDIRGPGALDIRKELYRHHPPMLEFPSRDGPKRFCRLVATYKHLGTVFSHRGRLLPEIRHRLGQARQAFRKHRKMIFSNVNLPIKTRTQLFVTLVLSVLQFNIAIWPALSNNEHQAFAKGVQALYHSLAYAFWGKDVYTWRVEKVSETLGLSQTDILLRNARLRYLQHLTLKADQFVWAYIHLDPGWLGLVRADLTWLHQQLPFSIPARPPEDSWEDWEALVRHRTRWKALVQRACSHADGQRALRSNWHEGHRRALEVLEEMGVWKNERRKINAGVHACLRCRKRFSGRAAWSVHAFRAHGRVTKARTFATGFTCVICNKVYALHSRLVNHLRYSTACAEAMHQRGLVAVAQLSIGSRKEQKARLKVLAPVLKSAGPELPGGQQHHAGGLDERHDDGQAELCENIYDVLVDGGTEPFAIEPMVGRVWQAFQQSVVHPDDMLELLRQCIEGYTLDLEPDDVEDYALLRCYEILFNTVQGRWSCEWLLGDIDVEHTVAVKGAGELDEQEEFEKLMQQRVDKQPVPRPIKLKCLILLHLFSGRRREGDIQASFEQLSAQACFPHYGLSVDVVISLEWGNLLRDEIRNFFLSAIRESQVASTIAGPPCETWSKAREEYYRSQQGPRPIRACATPWGIAQLRLREMAQLRIGNLLLFVAIQFAYVSWAYGSMMALEHPAEPESEYSVSIWKLPIIMFLMKQPSVRRWRLYQGHFGAPSAKPTDMLLIHPPDNYREVVDAFQTRQWLPKEASIGRTDQGVFKTQRLKEYPVPLCRALAQLSFVHAMARGHDDLCQDPSPKMGEMLFSLRSEVGEGNLGPDYCAAAVQHAWAELCTTHEFMSMLASNRSWPSKVKKKKYFSEKVCALGV